MTKYVEEFQIPGAGNYCITESEPYGKKPIFNVRTGGCSIGDYLTVQTAREKIYEHAIGCLRAVKGAAELRLSMATLSLDKLGERDVFKLGQFQKSQEG